MHTKTVKTETIQDNLTQDETTLSANTSSTVASKSVDGQHEKSEEMDSVGDWMNESIERIASLNEIKQHATSHEDPPTEVKRFAIVTATSIMAFQMTFPCNLPISSPYKHTNIPLSRFVDQCRRMSIIRVVDIVQFKKLH